jgi:DNA-binding CsgD family transcriptional regulator
VELLLDGLALLINDGRAAAAPALRRAVSIFASDGISAGDGLRWAWLATVPALLLWDDDGWRAILARQVQLVRDAGALEHLVIYLESAGTVTAWSGDFGAAASLIAETRAVGEAIGARLPPLAALLLAGLRGSQAEAVPLIEATISAAEAEGQGLAVTVARWAAAIHYNGLGRYADAEAAAGQASRDMPEIFVSAFALTELIEAAVRTGDTRLAAGAVDQLTDTTRPGGTDWGLGTEARSRALISQGRPAEGLYREAIDRLGRTGLRPELARAHLLYGEWLRRENRRTDAREQLRTAYDMMSVTGMEAFAERARRELAATGETPRKRPAQRAVVQELTAQEAQVAQLARDGLSNPEIGARLFLSSHTVHYHLSKVFGKLGITSRSQLHLVLPGGPTRPHGAGSDAGGRQAGQAR